MATPRMTGKAKIALILAGAVAKGAFEAGALRVLLQQPVQVRRILAVSSGGLNGTLLAAGVRTRDERATAETLIRLWTTEARWTGIFHPSLHGVFRAEGLSDQSRLLQLLRDHVPVAPPGGAPIDLRFVIAPLLGIEGSVRQRKATTFEAVLSFEDEAFDSAEGLERIFEAAVASAAFPGAFAPVPVTGLGPCLDGGVVNNAPIHHALDGVVGDDVDAVVVVVPTPWEWGVLPEDLHLPGLVGHLANVLINERLYRDLKAALAVNEALERLDALGLGATQVQAVKEAIGWGSRRRIPIIAIRPDTRLPGGAFSALFEHHLAGEYIQAGEEAALRALAEQDLGARPAPR